MPTMPRVRNLTVIDGLEGLKFTPSIGISTKRLDTFGMALRNFREPLTGSVKEVIIPSFKANFKAGGRPEAWQPLSPVTIERREEAGFSGGPVLVRTGALEQVATSSSIWSIDATQAVIADLPEKVWYGKVQQSGYGSAKGRSLEEIVKRAQQGKGGSANIPARPWALLQDEDYDGIERIFARWLQKKMVETQAFRPSGGV